MNTLANILPASASSGPGSSSCATSSSSTSSPGDNLFSDELNRAQTRAQEPVVKPAAKKPEDQGKAKSTDQPDAKPSSEKDAKADSSQTPATDAPAAAKDQPKPKAQNDSGGDNTPAVPEPRNAGQILKVAKINPPSGSMAEDASNSAPSPVGDHDAAKKGKADAAAASPRPPTDLTTLAAANATANASAPPAPSAPHAAPVPADSLPDTSTAPTAPTDDLKLMAPALKATPEQGTSDSTNAAGDATANMSEFSSALSAASDKDHAKIGASLTEVEQALNSQAAPAPTAHPAPAVFSATPIPVAQSADGQFVQDNHASIVTSIHSQMLPDGGTMQIRLDPPELGAMHVTVTMDGGVLSASFQTSSDQATRLLSHTLGQLKSALESQGVSVEHLQVQQSAKPRESANSGSNKEDGGNQQAMADQRSSQQENQRREAVRRMWARLSGGRDPLDMVA